jgi:hypothetical protein
MCNFSLWPVFFPSTVTTAIQYGREVIMDGDSLVRGMMEPSTLTNGSQVKGAMLLRLSRVIYRMPTA